MTDDLLAELVPDAVELARCWAQGRARAPRRAQPPVGARQRRATARLGELVRDPEGLGFAIGFVDRVTRPDDRAVAARELGRMAAGGPPAFLGGADRLLFRLGRLAPVAPWPAVPLAKARMRALVGELVVDSDPGRLTTFLRESARAGFRTNLNLLGEAVLGEAEAARRAEGVARLIALPGADTVSVKVSSLVPQLSTWDHAGSVERIVAALDPLLALAAAHDTTIALDMEEYRDLALTLDAFERTVLDPRFLGVDVTIALQAYLPDIDEAAARVVRIGADRAAAGGRDVKIRLVKGANLSMEHVDALIHGWPEAPYPNKPEVDAAYVRVFDRLLTPASAAHVRLGLAGHNLFHLALGTLLARRRGVADRMEIEMLHGMAPAPAAAVLADTDAVLLYTPVVAAADFDVAIAYLTRRLEEAAAPQNVIHDLVDPDPDLTASEEAFRISVRDRAAGPARAVRASAPPPPPPAPGEFENVADSDPTDPRARAWAADAVSRGLPDGGPDPLVTAAQVDAVVEAARKAGTEWRTRPPAERARVLRVAAEALRQHRAELVAVMAAEAGKTVAESDPEISEAIDFAAYDAWSAEHTLTTELSGFEPFTATLVVPPWNFPVAIPLGGVFAALAAGSAAVLKPAPQTWRCGRTAGEVVSGALEAAGAPADLLTVVQVPEDEIGRHLITHRGFDRVVLTGALETAARFLSWRPDLPLIGETSGKNAVVVTPAADLDLAVADVVRSAFGHAGQKCSAASLLITVGGLGESVRFRQQLLDAVRSLRVAWPDDLGAAVGPVIEPPTGKLRRALTSLEPGERWLLEPASLDDTGRLWRPGVKDGVRPGSFFHRTECFGPVLGLMAATDLEEAVDWQNDTGFSLTGGIHSLDDTEVERWLDRVEVGNAYVNRGITGAIVRRQPFGGWNRSVVGPGAKPGGPSYVAQFGTWSDLPDVAGLDADAWLEVAIASDVQVWAEEFGRGHDPSDLGVESNVLRYRPVPRLTLRVAQGAAEAHVRRVLSVAARAGVPVRISHVATEDDAAFAARISSGDVVGRVRVIGSAQGVREAAAGRVGDVTVLDRPVVADGRREGLTVLREQAVSRTMHRFGHPVGRPV